MKIVLSCIMLLLFFQPLNAAEKITPYILTAQDKVTLEQLERYLTNIQTIAAEFTQIAPGGEVASGTFYLERPGKLRMEYAPPTPVLMVTDGSTIIYYDKELDQISRIPLESTLVGFLAREKVRFDDTVIITGFEHKDNATRISLIQHERPQDGTLTLAFSDNPIALHAMMVTDNAGQKTTVSLNNARFNTPLAKELFAFKDPHLGRKSGIQN